MSDHSHDHDEPQNPIAKVIGKIFIFAVPAALIAMLTIVGASFVNGALHQPVVATPVALPQTTPQYNVELGKATYATCMACHGADGQGMKPAPTMSMAPSFVGSELLLHENPEVSTLILLKGIKKEGMEYMGMMAGLGAALDDQKMAAVLSYTRKNFGNKGSVITTEQVAAARAKFADVNEPLGIPRADILKVVEAHK